MTNPILIRRNDTSNLRLLNDLDQQTERANRAEDIVALYRRRFALMWKEDWFKQNYPKLLEKL